VRIQLEQLLPISGTGIGVRTDRVVRIVGSPDADLVREPPPGTVELADGRRFIARSIRWQEYGLAMLTPEGIIEATYPEIVEAVLPGALRTAAVLDDNLWAGGTAGGAVVRFQTTGGAIITTSRISREVERSRRGRRGELDVAYYYYVQPAWAEQPLAIPEKAIAWCGYRRADEVPLSLLPGAELASSRLVGSGATWRRNRSAEGVLPASGQFESDLGLVTHSRSEIAFDLPVGAQSLVTAVGLDRAVGSGGCVRCQILGPDSKKILWDSDILLGSYGPKPTGPIDVAGLAKVVLVTDFAHEGRPAGADPLDIRDDVVWLAPLVRLDLSAGASPRRLLSVLAGLEDWDLAGEGWKQAQISTRWNWSTTAWEAVVSLPRGAEIKLTRKLNVSHAGDIVELRTACPEDLTLHNFTLSVDGQPVPWTTNADRELLRSWVRNYYSRARGTYDRYEDTYLSDRLAYWWDLQSHRGKEVTLELILGSPQAAGEIVWRGFSVRSAVSNLPAEGKPLRFDVPLTEVQPLRMAGIRDVMPAKDGIPTYRVPEPIRFLGQKFTGGYGVREGCAVMFPLAPEYRKFVAVVGCCYQAIGPLRVTIDDKVVWEKELAQGLSPAEQIEVEIPAGAKTLTLSAGVGGPYNGHAAWASAGFVTGRQ
jgi:hypothetical protein